MSSIYKSEEGAMAVRKRYLQILTFWPVANEQLKIATGEGETFVIASGAKDAPVLMCFHGAQSNAAAWIGDVAALSRHFRVYVVDVIGDAGLSAPSRPPLDSEAHALWLDDLMKELGVARASIVGMSLGGWLALDYATRRPRRVERLAVLCPAGVGSQKNFLLKALPLLMLGAWGRRKMAEKVFGPAPANPPPGAQFVMSLFALIHQHQRRRIIRIPRFSNEALRGLHMPVMAIVGGRDVLLDSAQTRDRLLKNVPHAQVVYLPDAPHLLRNQTATIVDFLLGTYPAQQAAAAPVSG